MKEYKGYFPYFPKKIEHAPYFPSTSFQGSKFKIVDWIWGAIKNLDFHTALDTFGGTGCVGYALKEKGTLKVGADADITIVDLNKEWVVNAKKLKSKSMNTPFDGWKMKGRVSKTIVSGKVVHDDLKEIS
ncbi:MAG: amidohydrolase family protein [Deltaproteobacteria bacterium]|nr:amidohydrolase family protein [Deltaproteobacteria bacterium]